MIPTSDSLLAATFNVCSVRVATSSSANAAPPAGVLVDVQGVNPLSTECRARGMKTDA
jgi:hypothetical protein